MIIIQCVLAFPSGFAQLRVQEKDLKGKVRITLDSPTPKIAQLNRRARNNRTVKAMGLPVLATLPVTEDESSIKPRSTDEIVKRCIAVEICAVKGESNDQQLTMGIVKRFGAAPFFSPKENAFIKNSAPSYTDRANFAWQYERVHVLLWALGLIDKLKGATEICDVPGEVKIIKNASVQGLIAKAKPRTMGEVMDQADLYYRLHWAVIDLRLKGQKSDKANEEIIDERHRALNWLIRYMNQSWDDVSADT